MIRLLATLARVAFNRIRVFTLPPEAAISRANAFGRRREFDLARHALAPALSVALALAVALAGLPVAAGPVTTMPVYILPRDSDGIVISIIDVIEVWPQGGFDGIVPGEVYYTLGGIELDGLNGGGALQGGTAPLTPVVLGGNAVATALANDTPLQIGTAAFRVEAQGGKVWLRNVATGQRHAALARVAPMTPDAEGLAVNPQGFALD